MKVQISTLLVGLTTLIGACGITGKETRNSAIQTQPSATPRLKFQSLSRSMNLENGKKVFVFGSTLKANLPQSLLVKIDQEAIGLMTAERENLIYQPTYEGSSITPNRNRDRRDLGAPLYLLRSFIENEVLLATDESIDVKELRNTETPFEVSSNRYDYCAGIQLPPSTFEEGGIKASFYEQNAICNVSGICNARIHVTPPSPFSEKDDRHDFTLNRLKQAGATCNQLGMIYQTKTTVTNVSRLIKLTIPLVIELMPES